jgi:hypothetical protein
LESRRLIAKAAIPGAQAPVERDVATRLNGFIFYPAIKRAYGAMRRKYAAMQ